MKDPEFLHWVAERLVFTYGESEDDDTIRNLRRIARLLEAQAQATRCTCGRSTLGTGPNRRHATDCPARNG